MPTAAPHFTSWLDGFFDAYYRHHPVNGTFIGDHRHDHRLPDLSDAGVGDALADIDTLLARLAALPEEPLSDAEAIDRTLAEGHLHIQRWEYGSGHFQAGNPSFYTGEAVFGLLGLLLVPHGALAERVAAATARMRGIPALLEQCRTNVRRAPRAWTLRAIRECDGALAFLDSGLEQWMHGAGIDDGDLRGAAQVARAAFAAGRSHFTDRLLENDRADYACGEETFALLLRRGHCLEMDGAEILARAEDALDEAQSHLDTHAADFGASTPADALAQLADSHPAPEEYYDRYREMWIDSRRLATERNLLTWPDFPIEYVPRPLWSRAAAPHLYFLFYRSPPACNRPAVHRYLVEPLEPDWSPAETRAFLRRNNDSVIKLNHVVHHGGIGHHVQNWHAFRAPSRIGRMAAVDCAARIAMLCGGTMAEGWACYATGLMAEAGFLTPLERYAEHQSRRRMSARAIVDVRLHRGEWSLEACARFYAERAGMDAGAARAEAVKNSMFPACALIYLIGTDLIRDLRRRLSARTRPEFNLADFHDTFLAHGSIPVSLIAAHMAGRTRADV